MLEHKVSYYFSDSLQSFMLTSCQMCSFTVSSRRINPCSLKYGVTSDTHSCSADQSLPDNFNEAFWKNRNPTVTWHNVHGMRTHFKLSVRLVTLRMFLRYPITSHFGRSVWLSTMIAVSVILRNYMIPRLWLMTIRYTATQSSVTI